MNAADAYLKPYQQLATTLPASYTPLQTKPPAGGSVVHLIGPLPDEIPLSQAQQAAAQAIGWKFTALSYVNDFVLPNFYFHSSMVYALLRKSGVEIGKGDFLGAIQ